MSTVPGEGDLPSAEARETPTLSGRHRKRQRKAERYLGGQACAAYKQHNGDLSRSFTDDHNYRARNPCLKDAEESAVPVITSYRNLAKRSMI